MTFGDKRHVAMRWSMDRQGIRTLFDRESKRLKQFELSERVSLESYADETAARDASVKTPGTASGPN
jgi:hypothetical protein